MSSGQQVLSQLKIWKLRALVSKFITALRAFGLKLNFKCVFPSVTYSFSVWGNFSPSTMNSLNSIHARASHIIGNLQSPLADDICLSKSNWLPLCYFNKKSVLLMHKVYFETSCQSVRKLFSKKTTSRWTHFPNQLNIISFKSNTGGNTLQYRGPVIGNFLHRLVKVPENFNCYKQIL